MGIIDLLNSLTPQAVFAIVGSVVAIVTGLFGYLIKVHNDSIKNPPTPSSHKDDQLQKIHDRISEVKDRLATVEGEVKLTVQKGNALQKQLDNHEDRDERNFENLDQKIDRVTDILMKILTDDKL